MPIAIAPTDAIVEMPSVMFAQLDPAFVDLVGLPERDGRLACAGQGARDHASARWDASGERGRLLPPERRE